MTLPVDIFIALMNAGFGSVQEQNAHAFRFWEEHVDMEFHADSVQHVIDFSDSTEQREGGSR